MLPALRIPFPQQLAVGFAAQRNNEAKIPKVQQVVYTPTQWAHQIWSDSVENCFPCNISQGAGGLAGRAG